MKQLSLNGEWLYRIGHGKTSPITVPFSRSPVGHSECIRYFDLTENAPRVFLKFDGITYYAKVLLNGVELGEMLPYCEYEFEITECVKPTHNELTVELEDIDRAFGPSEGWENFGGIIRDVHLLYREKQYIKRVFFHAELEADYKNASMQVEIEADCEEGDQFQIELLDQNAPILSYTHGVGKTLAVPVKDVKLWSPDTPYLYSLRVCLLSGGHPVDESACAVGFRSVTTERHRFLLNGKPLFFKGVCKHEMIGDSGHCPTLAQMEKDMRMIKDMGCNFVRLVHYPHNKKILELADRMGLMVSEEPGLWWADTANPEVKEGSKEVLKRTILRDRNHPSIAFWLCFNECRFTKEYLLESAAVCRQYDPTRLVSGANCMNDEDTYYYYNLCGFDFYTMHPYASSFKRSRKSAKVLYDKPLMFTEWGGYYVYNNPDLLLFFMKQMNELYHQNSDEGALAGATFWFFAELNDFNRDKPACIDGVLREGLVDSNRNPTVIFDTFCQGLKLFGTTPTDAEETFWYEGEIAQSLAGVQGLSCAQETDRKALLATIQADTATKGSERKRKIKHGPFLLSSRLLSRVPYTVTADKTLVWEGNGPAKTVTVIGLTSPTNGYPLGGAYGEEACVCTVVYEDGTTQAVPLQNGVHLTTAFTLNGSSRIDPLAELAERFAQFGYDKNFERYVINRLDIATQSEAAISRIEFKTTGDRYLPLIYGVFTH